MIKSVGLETRTGLRIWNKAGGRRYCEQMQREGELGVRIIWTGNGSGNVTPETGIHIFRGEHLAHRVSRLAQAFGVREEDLEDCTRYFVEPQK